MDIETVKNMDFSFVVYCSIHSPLLSSKQIERAGRLIAKRLKKKGMASVHLVGERKIRSLNRDFRGQDRVTDVLSFEMNDKNNMSEENDWGDLFLCQNQIKRQALRFGVSEQEECVRMLAHGLLHLFGYDHKTSVTAKIMFTLQEKLVKL